MRPVISNLLGILSTLFVLSSWFLINCLLSSIYLITHNLVKSQGVVKGEIEGKRDWPNGGYLHYGNSLVGLQIVKSFYDVVFNVSVSELVIINFLFTHPFDRHRIF